MHFDGNVILPCAFLKTKMISMIQYKWRIKSATSLVEWLFASKRLIWNNPHYLAVLAWRLFAFLPTTFFEIAVLSIWKDEIIIAAAVTEPEASERGSSLIGKKLRYSITFSYQTQGIVVVRGSEIYDAQWTLKELWLSANGRFRVRSGLPHAFFLHWFSTAIWIICSLVKV